MVSTSPQRRHSKTRCSLPARSSDLATVINAMPQSGHAGLSNGFIFGTHRDVWVSVADPIATTLPALISVVARGIGSHANSTAEVLVRIGADLRFRLQRWPFRLKRRTSYCSASGRPMFHLTCKPQISACSLSMIQRNGALTEWPLLAQSGRSPGCRDVRSLDAGSTGRRNTGIKSLCWRFKLQGLTWPLV